MESSGALSSAYVSLTAAEASSVLQELFSISGLASRLETEKDDTFKISAGARKYILKIANPAERLDEISFQTEILRHIQTSNPNIPIPRVISGNDGGELQWITDSSGQKRYVRLMSYLEGTPLDSTHSTELEREKIGEILGQLRLATATFSHPADARTLAWDVQHLTSLSSLIGEMTDQAERDLLNEGMARFEHFSEKIKTLRRQVLHNDFSRSNIIVDHSKSEFVVGIIDFGDTVRTAIAIDVSTALLNQLPTNVSLLEPSADIFETGRALLRGYLRVADLTTDELALIPHLVMGRIIARALLTNWRAKLFPGNAKYILRNTAQGWDQLRWFLQRPISTISETFL